MLEHYKQANLTLVKTHIVSSTNLFISIALVLIEDNNYIEKVSYISIISFLLFFAQATYSDTANT